MTDSKEELVVNEVIIDEPAQGHDRHVRDSDKKICAKGRVVSALHFDTGIQLYARVMPNPGSISVPPTGPYAETTADGSGHWKFEEIDGAVCAPSAPYPDNSLVVWAKFPSSSGDEWAVAVARFKGECRPKTDCET